MNQMFRSMTKLERVQIQQTCKFMYEIGAARSDPDQGDASKNEYGKIIFTDKYSSKFKHTVFVHDPKTRWTS